MRALLTVIWPGVLAVLAGLFLVGLSVGRSLAEEPAYWPPCGEPGADWRCPWGAPDAGPVVPEDFRPCSSEGHAVRCDKGLDP